MAPGCVLRSVRRGEGEGMSRLRAGRAVLGALLCVGLFVGLSAAPAQAADIASDGPLRLVRVTPELNCHVNHVLDAQPEWYGGTACGTFISLNGVLHGPTSVPGGNGATPRMSFTRVSQSAVTGSGTEADPYTIVTVVDAGTRARLVQTDTYVVGREFYDTSVTVTNLTAATQVGQLYTAADCFLQDSDLGYGRISGSAPACTTAPTPGSRVEQLLPRTGDNAFFEGLYSTLWSQIGAQRPLSNTCQCDTRVDNAIGISWPVELAASASRSWEWSTLFSPGGDVPIIVTATAHAPTSTPGATNGYRINVVNDNEGGTVVSSIVATLPEGFTYRPGSTSGVTSGDPAVSGRTLTWTGPFALPSYGTIALDLDVRVADAPGTYALAATATVPNLDVSPVEGATIDVVPEADLALSKTVSAPTVVAGGAGVTYQLTARNAGPSPASGVFVTDVLPAGLSFSAATSSPSCFAVGSQVRCDIGTLDVGSQAAVTVGVTVPSTATAGIRTNSARVSGVANDPDLADNAASVPVTVTRSADLSIAKSADSATSIAGGTTTYTITVRNAGPSQTTATVTDVVPAGFTATSASSGCTLPGGPRCTAALAAGASRTFTLTGTVSAALPAGTVLTNTATVSTTDPDPNPANDTAAVSTTVQRSTDLRIEKTLDAAGLRAGSTGVFQITVTNAGPSVASQVTVTDVLPAGTVFSAGASTPGCSAAATPGATVTCPLGTLQPGQVLTLSIGAAVSAATPQGTVLSNTAGVEGAEPDPTPENNSATATGAVTRLVDLSVAKTSKTEPVTAGAPVTYLLTLANAGPSDASNVVMTDPLPSALGSPAATVTFGTGSCEAAATVTCTFPTLAAGQTASVEITATVDPAQPPGPLTNTASVTSTEPDAQPEKNTGTETTDVVATTGLIASKVDSHTPAVAGDPLSYTVTVTNQGPSTATGVALTDPLPDGFTATDVSSSACTLGPGSVTCPDLGTLAPGGSVAVTIEGRVAASMATGAVLENTATATDEQDSRVDANERTAVVRRADLAVTAEPTTASVLAGGVSAWTVTVTNHGPSNSTGELTIEPAPNQA